MSQQFVRQASLFRIPWVNRPPQPPPPPPPPPPPETSAPPPVSPPTTEDPKPQPLQRQLSSSTEIQIQSVSSQGLPGPSSPIFQPSQQPTTTSPSAPPFEDSPPAPAVSEALIQQQQTQTTDQSQPTAQAIPQSALRQSTSPSTEPLSGLSESEFQLTTPNEIGDGRPGLPKTQPEDPTQMKANAEPDDMVSQPERSKLGEMEKERLDDEIKPRELPAPPTRETSSPPKSPGKLETPTSSHPSSPSKQASLSPTKSIPSSETQPPSRLSTIQPEQSSDKDTIVQPLPSEVLPQDPDLKEQSSPKQQLLQALEQTQTQRVVQSDRETKEPSQDKTPATTQPTSMAVAVPDAPFLFHSQEKIHDPTHLNDEPPKSEIDDGKPEIEIGAKTKEVPASIADDDELKRRTTAKLPNLEIESNKHVAGQSDIRNQAEKEKNVEQPSQNKSEMATTAFQAIEGEAAPTLHPKKKTAESWSQTKSSALQREPASFNKKVNEGFSRYAHKLVQGLQNRTLDEYLTGVTVLCGVNTGASMHMTLENSKAGQSNFYGEVHAEGESGVNQKKSNGFLPREGKASKTYVNNNVQCVNNSILYTSYISEKTPGVHLAYSHQPKE